MHEPSGMNEDLKARYLQTLGLDESPPTLGFLNRIISAHLVRIPFENISKLHRFRLDGRTSIPSLDSYLDGIEGMNFGGTCYANNTHLYILLCALGFKVKLCGADMSRPDVHVVSMVEVDGREYLADVGYGAPFFKPMARDLETEHTIDFGRCRYVLHPRNAEGRSRLEMIRDGRSVHGYLAKPDPRDIKEFAEVVRNSYRSDATFMNTVVAERFFPGRSVRIHNLKLTETAVKGQSRTTELHDFDELIDAIDDRFGIPPEITRQALEGINLDADIYS